MGDKRPDLGEPWATRSPAEKAHDEALLADLRRMVVGSEGPLSPWEIDSMADQRVGLVAHGSRARYGIEHAVGALKSAAASARGG